ncbi:MAG: hypothetical protein IT447_04720 [Phycisphaerales bacterium]|jgi:hypothetical protein|nr:hypothetical protein [Phycisphaerales bacterium]
MIRFVDAGKERPNAAVAAGGECHGFTGGCKMLSRTFWVFSQVAEVGVFIAAAVLLAVGAMGLR